MGKRIDPETSRIVIAAVVGGLIAILSGFAIHTLSPVSLDTWKVVYASSLALGAPGGFAVGGGFGYTLGRRTGALVFAPIVGIGFGYLSCLDAARDLGAGPQTLEVRSIEVSTWKKKLPRTHGGRYPSSNNSSSGTDVTLVDRDGAEHTLAFMGSGRGGEWSVAAAACGPAPVRVSWLPHTGAVVAAECLTEGAHAGSGRP